MEVVILPQAGLRIKGKHTSFAVDIVDKASSNAIILLTKSHKEIGLQEEIVVVNGPGEYEIGGVKMTGTRGGDDTVYSLKIDGVEVVLGKIAALEKLQQKLKEHNIVVAQCDGEQDGSFLTSLAANVIIFYGEKAREISAGLSKENVKIQPKYQTTLDKLPPEVETVVLE